MNFKKSGNRVFGVTLNKAEREAMEREIRRQIAEHDREFEIDRESSVLWMLHTEFGFGAKRLRRAWELMYADGAKLREYYETEPDSGAWLERNLLREKCGVDIEKWYNDWESGNER